MIYFAQDTEGGPIKIGFSDDVPSRIRQLEHRYQRSLVVLATMPGGVKEERAIHDRFAHLRLGRTEQFTPAPDLFDFIGRPLLIGANPETVEAMAVKVDVVVVRCRRTWKDWLQELADKERVTPSMLIDQALAQAATKLGFEEPPRRL